MNVDEILAVLADDLTRIAVGYAVTGNVAVLRINVGEMLRSHGADLARHGLREHLHEAAHALIQDEVTSAVSSQRLHAKFLWWSFQERVSAGTEGDWPSVEDVGRFYDLKKYMEVVEVPEAIWQDLLPSHVQTQARKALERIQHFPFRYELFVRTPVVLDSSPFGKHENFGEASLECMSGTELSSEDVVHSERELSQQQLHDFDWDESHYYLTRRYEGFIPWEATNFESSTTAIRNDLKSLVGLCVALDILTVSSELSWDHVEPILIFGDSEGASDMKFALRWLPPEEAAVVGSMRSVPSETDASVTQLKRHLSWIFATFRRRDGLLLNAGRWFFESHSGSNPLLQLLQATTVLEILFGEHDEKARRRSALGTTELLANRYSYLVGRTPEERSEAQKRFAAVYEERSRVIHSGKNDVDRSLLNEARSMAARAIRREIAIHSEV